MSTLMEVLQVVVSLGVVFGLLVFLSRKFSKSSFVTKQRGRRSASLEVVARKGIGGKASIVVVDVEGERLVLGVSEHGVNLLTSGEAPAPEAALELVAPAHDATVTSADAFRRELEAQDQPVTRLSQPARPDRRWRVDPEPAVGAPADAAEPLPMRPRNRTRQPQQLQGSILSADTWKQAAAALRSRRVG
jgi:flagellar protein FliO/FliZ